MKFRAAFLTGIVTIAVPAGGWADDAGAVEPGFVFADGNLSYVNDPASPVLLGCGGDAVTNQGDPIVPTVACSAVALIEVFSAPSVGVVNQIDLRNVLPTAFPALRQGLINGNGNDLIYGTFTTDSIIAAGTAYGLGGDDNMIVGGRAFGGGGNDVMQGGSGPDVLNGGFGADTLFGDSDGRFEDCPGGDTYLGGPGNDTIDAVSGDVSVGGGLGNDLIRIEVECPGSSLVVDGNEGTDRVSHVVFRSTSFIVRAASGSIFRRATSASPPERIYRHQRVEKVEIAGSGDVRLVMQTGVDFDVQPSFYGTNKIDITVPGGVWTLGDHRVTAPGLGRVVWTDFQTPTPVTVHA